MAKKTIQKAVDPDLQAFIEDLLKPGDVEQLNVSRSEAEQGSNSLFSEVAKRANRRGPGTAKISLGEGKSQVEICDGALISMMFNSEADLTRFLEMEMPPEAAAWRRIAQIARGAIEDPLIAKSPDAIAFLRMIDAIANNTAGTQGPDAVMRPIAESIRSQAAVQMRNQRTEKGSAVVKAKALELYDANSWKSVADGAKQIFQHVQTYAGTLEPKQVLSVDRFEKTLREWLNQRKN